MTVRDTLTRAIRFTGARALGDTPDAAEMTAALDDFQNMLMSLPRTALTDVLISANYTAGENERITDSSGTATITRPTTITDSVTGVVRPPRNGAVIEVASATSPTRHIYIAELKSWMQVNGLALTSTQPFGPEHEAGLSAMLAARIAWPVFRRQLSPDILNLAEQGRRTVRQRFRQTVHVTTDPLLLNVFQRTGATI
jgi:hypothetical protein